MYSCVFFFKQKTAYEMRISDWSSDVCSSDLRSRAVRGDLRQEGAGEREGARDMDVEHRLEIGGRHRVERLLDRVAGVVDQNRYRTMPIGDARGEALRRLARGAVERHRRPVADFGPCAGELRRTGPDDGERRGRKRGAEGKE